MEIPLRAENVVAIRQGKRDFRQCRNKESVKILWGFILQIRKIFFRNLFETRMLIEPQDRIISSTKRQHRRISIIWSVWLNRWMKSRSTAQKQRRWMYSFIPAVAECTHNDVLIRVVPIINDSIRPKPL